MPERFLKEKEMVTFGFLLVFTILGQLTIMIDIFLFQYSYTGAIRNLYYSQISADRLILYMTFLSGFIWAIITDIRIKKKRKQ